MARGRISLELIGLGIVVLAACSKTGGEPVSTPPASAIEVPAVPPANEPARADELPEARREARSDQATQDESLEFEVTEDGGSVHVSSSGDGGVRFWGRFTSLDGGFSFQGGFSTGASVGAGQDAGKSSAP